MSYSSLSCIHRIIHSSQADYYRPHPKVREGNIFSLFVCSHLEGYSIQLMGGGGKCLRRSGQGVPHPADRGYPFPGGGGEPCQGVSPSRAQQSTRPAHHVLATRWAVCLLHSHRRTSLFEKVLDKNYGCQRILMHWTYKHCQISSQVHVLDLHSSLPLKHFAASQ